MLRIISEDLEWQTKKDIIFQWFERITGNKVRNLVYKDRDYGGCDNSKTITIKISNEISFYSGSNLLISFSNFDHMEGKKVKKKSVMLKLLNFVPSILVDCEGNLPSSDLDDGFALPSGYAYIPIELAEVCSKETAEIIRSTEIRNAIYELEDKVLCKICYNNSENMKLICKNKHRFCSECLKLLSSCPLCREAIIF